MYNLIKESNAVRDGFYQEVADAVYASLTRGNVLDVGTGRGLLPLKIAEKSIHLKAYGADVSPKAIEAARAGESGRGFAVVADEITKLADAIAQSLKDIDNLVRANEKEIQQGIGITENTVATITNVIQGIESVNLDVNTMGQKIREQSEIFNETKIANIRILFDIGNVDKASDVDVIFQRGE